MTLLSKRIIDKFFFFTFQLTCTVKSTGKKRTIPVIVRVSDVNDNAPMFLNTPYETSVAEVRKFQKNVVKLWLFAVGCRLINFNNIQSTVILLATVLGNFFACTV